MNSTSSSTFSPMGTLQNTLSLVLTSSPAVVSKAFGLKAWAAVMHLHREAKGGYAERYLWFFSDDSRLVVIYDRQRPVREKLVAYRSFPGWQYYCNLAGSRGGEFFTRPTTLSADGAVAIGPLSSGRWPYPLPEGISVEQAAEWDSVPFSFLAYDWLTVEGAERVVYRG